MQHISARDAKNNFGRLIDDARAAPVAVDKHGRAVVVVLAVEEYERLVAAEVTGNKKRSGAGTPRTRAE
jgi:prevent-host-death family protein